jgi:ADP-heptose:LPS heptosyltransferase
VEAIDAPVEEAPLPKRRVEAKETSLPLFRPSLDEVAEMKARVEQRCGGEPERPLVILNPNLIDTIPVRRWPRDHYLELGRRILAARPDATLLLVGLPEERELSDALARDISPERCFSLAGETTLRSLVVLFGLADLLVTSDCGPAHMAALTEVPIVSLFGPETHRLYAPLSPHNHSLEAGLACGPCLSALNLQNSPCRDNVCMRHLTVEQVYAAARQQCPAIEPDLGTPLEL